MKIPLKKKYRVPKPVKKTTYTMRTGHRYSGRPTYARMLKGLQTGTYGRRE